MSFKELSPETIAAIKNVVAQMGGALTGVSISIHMERVCDHCRDESREAFPYYVKDETGRDWAHLCNTCFDLLGCEIKYDFDGLEPAGKGE